MTGVGGSTDGHGVVGQGVGGGYGVFALGGGSSGLGVLALGGDPNGTGLVAAGVGTGPGVLANGGGSNGDGVSGQGGGTFGRGVVGIGGIVNGAGVQGNGGGTGPGVRGDGATGDGVMGVASSGAASGVHGFCTSPSGFGVLAENTGDGTALKVIGPSVFSRSGTVAIASPAKSATVTGVALMASSLVLATVQNNVGVIAASAVPNVPGSSFKVNLNKAPGTGKTATVAWFVVN